MCVHPRSMLDSVIFQKNDHRKKSDRMEAAHSVGVDASSSLSMLYGLCQTQLQQSKRLRPFWKRC